jgi:hypothetical protein
VDPEFSPVTLGSVLHARLVDGDSTAAAAIAEIFLPLVLKRLAHYIAHDDDPHLAQQATLDAIWNYLENPGSYKPGKLDLLGYLVMSAKGDRLNSLDSVRRRAQHEVTAQPRVANWDGDSEYEAEYADTADFVAAIVENESSVYGWLAERLTSQEDLCMVELMLEGVHRTETYAIVLGITEMSPAEKARVVKQNKDRIKARLRRTLDPDKIRAEARGDD